jgi:hypothetical protein
VNITALFLDKFVNVIFGNLFTKDFEEDDTSLDKKPKNNS